MSKKTVTPWCHQMNSLMIWYLRSQYPHCMWVNRSSPQLTLISWWWRWWIIPDHPTSNSNDKCCLWMWIQNQNTYHQSYYADWTPKTTALRKFSDIPNNHCIFICICSHLFAMTELCKFQVEDIYRLAFNNDTYLVLIKHMAVESLSFHWPHPTGQKETILFNDYPCTSPYTRKLPDWKSWVVLICCGWLHYYNFIHYGMSFANGLFCSLPCQCF